MKNLCKTLLIMLPLMGVTASAQDWYHDRDARFQGEDWRGHVFEHVRVDIDHVGSAIWASGKERNRLERTKNELGDLQMKMEHARYDEGELNDVIDSMKKSANDTRLSSRDRDVLGDDLNRLRDYRANHDHWRH